MDQNGSSSILGVIIVIISVTAIIIASVYLVDYISDDGAEGYVMEDTPDDQPDDASDGTDSTTDDVPDENPDDVPDDTPDDTPPIDDGDGSDGTPDDDPTLPLAAGFTLPIVDDGGLLQLSSLRGKVVVLDFMATWCAPCATQMVELETIQSAYSESEVIIISIDVDDSEGEDLISSYIAEKEITWDVLRDGGGVASQAGYDVTSIPTIVIIDQDGYITFRNVGVTQDSELIAEINSLLP